MHIFYAPDIASGKTTLSPEESTHCFRVLRLKAGDEVEVIDGLGGYFRAVISGGDPKGCRLDIREGIPLPPARSGRIHIAIAPTKNMDRFEWFVEKAVEIGIDEITPLLCQRSERRVLKTDRLEKLVISTMKQAVVPIKPRLNELIDFKPFCASQAVQAYDRFIAHCMNERPEILKNALKPHANTLVLIGPEGDFTPDEVAFATGTGFKPVSLGDTRLRTETAGIVACAAIQLMGC